MAGLVIGQNLINPAINSTPIDLSFSIKFFMQVSSYEENVESPLTLWRGTRTLIANYLCYSLRGTENPLIIDVRISRSSVKPLCSSFS